MYSVQVLAESMDRLQQQVWTFWLDGCWMRLDRYVVKERPTTRHKFRVAKEYGGIDRRQNTLRLDDVPQPVWVRDQAIKNFIKDLRVGSRAERDEWKEWPDRD